MRATVADDIESELAVRCLDRFVNLTRRHFDAFDDQLEVVDQRLHRIVHVVLRWQHNFLVVDIDWPAGEYLHRLLDDAQALPHLFHTDENAVVAVAVLS